MKVICFQVIGDDSAYQTHITNKKKEDYQRPHNQAKNKATNEQLWKTLPKILYILFPRMDKPMKKRPGLETGSPTVPFSHFPIVS